MGVELLNYRLATFTTVVINNIYGCILELAGCVQLWN